MKKPTHIKKWNSEQLSHYVDKTSQILDIGGVFIGALDEWRLVGFALLAHEFLNDEKEMQLIFLYVSSSHRRKGTATRVFSAASESAKEKGAKRLCISATSSESNIQNFIGLEKFNKLKRLEIHCCTKLQSDDGISKVANTSVGFQNKRHINVSEEEMDNILSE